MGSTPRSGGPRLPAWVALQQVNQDQSKFLRKTFWPRKGRGPAMNLAVHNHSALSVMLHGQLKRCTQWSDCCTSFVRLWSAADQACDPATILSRRATGTLGYGIGICSTNAQIFQIGIF